MKKHKNQTLKHDVIIIDSMTVWNFQKPKYNGFICGHGTHGDKKYNRNKEKRKWEKYG